MKDEYFESPDKNEFESFVRQRNRQLHYQRAVFQRMERENRRRRLILLFLFIPLTSLMVALSLLVLDDKKYIDKKQVQLDLTTIVKNGGDLKAIRQAFSSQPLVSSLKLTFTSKSSYYDSSIPLSSVLADLRVNSFRDNEGENLPLLDRVISEYEQVNPFDKLLNNQKYYFENIRIKNGDDYPNISNDINNIADEMHQKNLLVEEYLGDSKMSFWISILAVMLSLLIGGYQIFSGRPEAMKKLILGAMNGFSDAGEENSNKKKQADS